ncbi:MAG TPA: cyclic nucleotide-binding domain-containing protein [Mariprofundaceae bacterium]|nr:cyclic nucleotide-binding domain-containing protein [Mariprofundaceae bacterium]
MAVDYNETFRQAREAGERGDFETARRLYAELWRSPLWHKDREVQLHYAYSCERTGDYSEAMQAYKSLMEHYLGDDRSEDVALVEESMTRLRELMAESEQDAKARVVDSVRDESEAKLVSRLFRHGYERGFAKGERICSLGDPASHMWLLLDGEVDVLIPHRRVTTMTGSHGRPCLIGELGYFTGMRRAASLICASAVRLIELPYQQIEEILGQEARLRPMLEHLFRHRLVMPVLSQHDIFKLINEVDRRRVTKLFENSAMRAGQVLIEQGAEEPNAFMVQSGTMLMTRVDARGEETLLGSMHPGDIFHLAGLLRGVPSPYRVMAGTPARLLRLSRLAFEPMMKQRPWLIKAILKQSRLAGERQIMHPEAKNLWAANRYFDIDEPNDK